MTSRPGFPLPALCLGAALLAVRAPAVWAQADHGSFVILQGGRAVGAERFEVSPDGDGSKTTASVSYLQAPLLSLQLSIVYHQAEQAFQLDRRQGEESAQVYAVGRRNRVTVRRVSPAGEKASEVPGGADLVLLADSAFAPLLRFIPLAADGPRTVKVLYPETGRRGAVRIERRPAPNGTGTLIRLSSDLEGEILVSSAGEVLRILLPGLGLEARRDSN
jgi:hypothetical protein